MLHVEDLRRWQPWPLHGAGQHHRACNLFIHAQVTVGSSSGSALCFFFFFVSVFLCTGVGKGALSNHSRSNRHACVP